MTTRFFVFLAVVACALFVTACGGSEEGPIADACAEIEGQTYLSVEQFECGQDPGNPELCNWSLTFADGNFDWRFSDILSNGTYTCDGPMVFGNPSDSNEIPGYLDAETGILTWNQIDYQLE